MSVQISPEMLMFVTSALFFGIIANSLIEILRLRKLIKSGEETTIQRVDKLTKALSQSTQLIDQISLEIDARQKLVDKLQKDIQVYNKIAEIKRSEVETVSQLLRGEIRKERRSSLWQNIIINFTFFCTGIVITYFTGFTASI